MDASARLFAALAERDAETVRELVTREPALAKARGPWGLPPLHHALYLRASQVVDALLAAGVEPTPFESAIRGDVAAVREAARRDPVLLLAQGPDGAPMLHLAAHFGHGDTVRTLLNLGAPLDLFAGGQFGNTALHAASAGGRAEVVDVLLSAGAKPDLPDKNGFTPLQVAAANGLVPAVKALLARGASPTTIAKDGRTALSMALEREHDEVASVLRAAGAPG